MLRSSFLQCCQGAITGAWQAANLGHWFSKHSPPHLWLAQWTPTPWQDQPLSPIGWQLADRCAQDLIHHGQVSPEHWLVGDQPTDNAPAQTGGDRPVVRLPTDAEILLALLPVALFYHDTPPYLVQSAATLCERVVLTLSTGLPQASTLSLQQRRQNTPGLDGITTAWQVLALALAHSCRRTLEPMTLIPDLLMQLATLTPTIQMADTQEQEETQELHDRPPVRHAAPMETGIVQCLQGVQQGLTQGAGLATVLPLILERRGTGIEGQVALALYCCLSAPGDFRSAVVRSLQATQRQPDLLPAASGIAALTGALAGSYQGGQGLPLALLPAHLWPCNVSPEASQAPAAGAGEISGRPAVLQQMAPLVAAWAGAYQPQGRTSLPAGVALPPV
ncbi:ADP-ribosylglycohydrolase family protein [Trichothermofontia sichuanensis B231]|uniref:ADP-ribosylglycohydrolase family protein n=1 Tax=Trichothermofontia sichuanensis TaxID=3045816 RepID=UPI0022466F85|nr:ADP-ribosylglycohydrolase family protein [Trichothermofontia sichuanensis]UZQ54094.1 ADP-ribosylglycohydrolase family protein [Trichothermofontia sichuanensis B231]